ncbi:MAG: glycosyltransferase family 87 protein [Roseovarius sp.]
MEQGEAEQRLSAFDHRRGWQLGLLGATATLMMTAGAFLGLGDAGLKVPVDFHVFWAAARLALSGDPLAAFDLARIVELTGISDGGWMPWAYPPGFLMLLMPLGALPFIAAWAAFTALSLVALILAVRPLAAGRMQVVCAVALAPALLPGLLIGQTSTLWAAGLVAALAALGTGRPWLAGVFIGLLTLKPQLGLLIPVALLAQGAWRAILSATLTALLLALLPTALFGTAYWPRMLEMMGTHGETVRGAIGGLGLMISPYSFLAGLGLPEALALALQWALTAALALAVWLAWRAPAATFDLRAAVLLTAIPLASPYLWHYESALLAPAALFMWRAGVLTPAPLRLTLAALMWLGLAPAALLLMQTGFENLFRLVFLPIAVTGFALSLGALLRLRNTTPAQAANSL